MAKSEVEIVAAKILRQIPRGTILTLNHIRCE